MKIAGIFFVRSGASLPHSLRTLENCVSRSKQFSLLLTFKLFITSPPARGEGTPRIVFQKKKRWATWMLSHVSVNENVFQLFCCCERTRSFLLRLAILAHASDDSQQFLSAKITLRREDFGWSWRICYVLELHIEIEAPPVQFSSAPTPSAERTWNSRWTLLEWNLIQETCWTLKICACNFISLLFHLYSLHRTPQLSNRVHITEIHI